MPVAWADNSGSCSFLGSDAPPQAVNKTAALQHSMV
jgi:hypothetical protein